MSIVGIRSTQEVLSSIGITGIVRIIGITRTTRTTRRVLKARSIGGKVLTLLRVCSKEALICLLKINCIKGGFTYETLKIDIDQM